MQTTGSAQSTSQYKLPYPAGVTYQVTQGNGGSFSHTNLYNFHAYDFGMAQGNQVVAARGGTVKSLYEGSNEGGCTSYYQNNWYKFTNYVVIDHGDGTSSLYAHLKFNSVVVNVGEKVSQGQKIAESGATGHVCNAHLHFSVQATPPGSNYQNSNGYWQQTKPSSFADPDVLKQNPNGVPTALRFYKSDNGNNFNPPPVLKFPLNNQMFPAN
jgi:murein DD-endopeptidase MepM/ murein hydrolase activator NlpD